VALITTEPPHRKAAMPSARNNSADLEQFMA
jgi:hypothetical protein